MGYYVYRFINKEGIIVYVGRTTNLKQRFSQHSHLTDDISNVEYIECATEADMAWREIYYINLFHNDHSTNVSDVYGAVTDIGLKDKWKTYSEFCHFDLDYNVVTARVRQYIKTFPVYDYASLIHIIEHKKLNALGEDTYALSKEWFKKHRQDSVNQLQKNLLNFFCNLMPKQNISSSKVNSWTTYSEYRDSLKGKGYSKGFVDLNSPDEELISNATNLAYLQNNFYPAAKPLNLNVSEDDYALSELLRFIWASDIRNGSEIWIYIPSSRMRRLLKEWICRFQKKIG